MNFKFLISNLYSNLNTLVSKIKIFIYSLKIINFKLKILLIAIVSLVSLFAIPYSLNPTFAQSKNNITASPQLIQLDLSVDKPEAEYTYTNNTNQTIELSLSMQDIKELEDRGIPGIIDPNVTRDYNFGLSNWARFSTDSLILAPGESKSVKVFIDKTRLTLGGHYGTVLAELLQKEDQKTVKLRVFLSTLLFVRSGSEYEQERANIVQITSNANPFSFPTSVTFRLQNSGNVDLTPYGLIRIINPLGDEVARGIINENSLITLPDSTRRYTVQLNRYADIMPPGIYTATIELKYGKKKFTIAETSYFFILSEANIYSLIGTLLLGAGIVLFIVWIRRKRSQQPHQIASQPQRRQFRLRKK